MRDRYELFPGFTFEMTKGYWSQVAWAPRQ